MTPHHRTTTVLRAIRKRLTRGWCQHAYAKNKNGKPVPPRSRKAIAWCLAGACYGSTSQLLTTLYNHIPRTRTSTPYVGWRPTTHIGLIDELAEWNDKPRRTKLQVLNLIDRTIKDLQKDTNHDQH